MLTCIILCKGFSRGSRLMQRFLPGFPAYGKVSSRVFSALGCSGLCKVPKSRLQGRTGSSRLYHPAPTVSSVCRAILASKDFFTVMASSGNTSPDSSNTRRTCCNHTPPCRFSLRWPCLLPGRHARRSRSPHIFPASPPASFPGTASKNGNLGFRAPRNSLLRCTLNFSFPYFFLRPPPGSCALLLLTLRFLQMCRLPVPCR